MRDCPLNLHVNLVKDDDFLTIDYYKGMDFLEYEISKYSLIVKKETTMTVKEIVDPLGYPKVILRDKKSNKSVDADVHKRMAHTFLQHEFTEESGIIDHVNSDKSNNRLSNLRIVTMEENNLFAHGLVCCPYTRRRGETVLFTSIRDCASAFFSVYPYLRSHLKTKLECETKNHAFYRSFDV